MHDVQYKCHYLQREEKVPSDEPEFFTLTLDPPCVVFASSCNKKNPHSGKSFSFEAALLDGYLPDWREGLAEGVFKPPPSLYQQISGWMDAAGKESGRRLCRLLLQIAFALEECSESVNAPEPAVDAALAFIHANYADEITLSALCKLVYVNRTTLTRLFKARTRRTPIDYLLHFRLETACGLLTHSNLSVGKIAEAVGFQYESYFIRQFSAKIGLTPAKYRQTEGFDTLNGKESRIFEEF